VELLRELVRILEVSLRWIREFGADYQKARLALLKEFKKLTEDNKEMRERIQKAAKYLMDDEDYDSGYNALRALGYV